MIPDRDMDTDYEHPDVVMPWRHIVVAAAWSLFLLVLLAPVVAAALLAVRLRTLALRALGRPVETGPRIEGLPGSTERRT